MQSRILIILCIIISINYGSDYYLYSVLKNLYKDSSFYIGIKLFLIASVVISSITYFGMFTSLLGGQGNRSALVNLLIGFTFAYLIGKVAFIGLSVFTEIIRAIEWGFNTETGLPSRRKFLVNSSIILAGIPFISLIYGMLRNKYNYKIYKQALTYSDLPEEFNGFKIVQISDIHSGSFDNVAAIEKGIDLINEQQADVVLFTGDLVNDHPNEIDPYIETFKKIKAKHGVFSTSGNHDYHYLSRNPQAQFSLLESKHEALGYKMLNNQHARISKNNQSVVIAGVENWGVPPFPQKGDLNKAFEGISENDFTILMSHDPSHWDAQILNHTKQVHLTLAGHTHGMQFGVELPGLKWSPVKYKYPRWAGLYEEGNQKLYVNRGFGFIGYPGRVGILPEITVIELKKG